MMYGGNYLGATDDIGLSPFKVEGNPVIALLAQLNRFAGKTVKPGNRCTGDRRYVKEPYPLVPVLNEQAAVIANMIVFDRHTCVPGVVSDIEVRWAQKATTIGYWVWAMNDLDKITKTIAQFADSLGLEPATVGITKVDERVRPKAKIPPIVFIAGGLILAAVFVAGRK